MLFAIQKVALSNERSSAVKYLANRERLRKQKDIDRDPFAYRGQAVGDQNDPPIQLLRMRNKTARIQYLQFVHIPGLSTGQAMRVALLRMRAAA